MIFDHGRQKMVKMKPTLGIHGFSLNGIFLTNVNVCVSNTSAKCNPFLISRFEKNDIDRYRRVSSKSMHVTIFETCKKYFSQKDKNSPTIFILLWKIFFTCFENRDMHRFRRHSSISIYVIFFESWNKKGIAFGTCITYTDINVGKKNAIKTEAMYT